MSDPIRGLVIDDSAAVAAYLRSLLVGKFNLEESISAEAAVEKLISGARYDVILLDLYLPGMSGMDFLRNLRATDSKTAVVILTGKGSARAAIEAMEQGADGFIEKQEIFADEFLHILTRAIERREGILARHELDDLRKDFYAAITHDMRSPIANASMALELLEAGSLTSEQNDIAAVLRSSLNRAMQLIEQYLDYEKIDSGFLSLQFTQADLVSITRGVAKNARPQAIAKKQEIVLRLPEQPLLVRLDESRIPNVIENLVSNALRYTPSGGRIEISIEQDTDLVHLSVRDNGMGIKPEEQKRIFQKFSRTRSAERQEKGTGLGLLIAKEIVLGHGGSISVQSTGIPGEGAVFTVQLNKI